MIKLNYINYIYNYTIYYDLSYDRNKIYIFHIKKNDFSYLTSRKSGVVPQYQDFHEILWISMDSVQNDILYNIFDILCRSRLSLGTSGPSQRFVTCWHEPLPALKSMKIASITNLGRRTENKHIRNFQLMIANP